MIMAIWTLRQSSADIERLATSTGLEPVLARILAVRGFRDPQAVYDFLHPKNCTLADPSSFRDMDAALNVACHAIDTQKKCCVFGDYDADGIMSTVILIRTLQSLGADVSYYIPQRENEGYGLNDQALDNLKDQGIEVIFACDNGISAFEQAQHAAELGLTLVILDHHAVTVNDGIQQLPKAAAVVDAKREDCDYPFKEYCAAGLCYRFSEALFRRLNRDWSSLGEQLLPFATIGTVCDLVELIGENRILVSRGLPVLLESDNYGLQALIEANGLQDHHLDTYHVGFILGPCINASGRLDIADTAVELFLADNKETARRLATRLVELNQQRRQLTEEGAKIAFQMIEGQGLDNDKVIVLYCDELQESVAGIIAGRVKEKYYRPSVIIVGRGDLVRGSCRSVE
ncbi:MAG: DHH family phosphoesterase, partial [Firmicutes bacterium]|nr:DHH family phosphoesterase [Bacillota bacterium]